MQNKPEDIFSYYFKELTIFKIAYGKWAGMTKLIIGFFAVLSAIIYFYRFNFSKLILFVIFFICFLTFSYYSKWLAVKHLRKNDAYFKNKQHLDFGDIRNIKLLEYIHNSNLLNVEGLKYLINIYNRKSDKFKYPKLTIWVFIIASIIQSTIDFCLNADGNEWKRIDLYVQFVENNIETFVISVVLIIIAYIYLKFIISNFYHYLLNIKSNRYSELCNLMEEKILPLVLCLDCTNDNEIYLRIVDNIDKIVYPLYLEKKAKRDCWIERVKRCIKFFYTCYRILRICFYKQIKRVEHLIRTIKSKIKISNRNNNKQQR